MHHRVVERALFIVGKQNTGKSAQLRSMFRDYRFGTQGKIPARLPRTVLLGNDRTLLLRSNSPHESGHTFRTYFNSIEQQLGNGRWCIAAALQPERSGGGPMPDAFEVISRFIVRFKPERVRICLLSPTISGMVLRTEDAKAFHRRGWSLGAEVLCINAICRNANGLLLADFFDFT